MDSFNNVLQDECLDFPETHLLPLTIFLRLAPAEWGLCVTGFRSSTYGDFDFVVSICDRVVHLGWGIDYLHDIRIELEKGVWIMGRPDDVVDQLEVALLK